MYFPPGFATYSYTRYHGPLMTVEKKKTVNFHRKIYIIYNNNIVVGYNHCYYGLLRKRKKNRIGRKTRANAPGGHSRTNDGDFHRIRNLITKIPA